MPPQNFPTPAEVAPDETGYDLAISGVDVEIVVRDIQEIRLADHMFKLAMKSQDIRDARVAFEAISSRKNAIKPPKQISQQDRGTIIINLSDVDGTSVTIKVSTPDQAPETDDNIFTIDSDDYDAETLGPTPTHILAAKDQTIFESEIAIPCDNWPFETQADIDIAEILAGFDRPANHITPPASSEPTIKISASEMREALKAREDRQVAQPGLRDIKMPDFEIPMNRNFS